MRKTKRNAPKKYAQNTMERKNKERKRKEWLPKQAEISKNAKET